MKVAILGASGNTGRSIVNGLLQSGEEPIITALVRPSSIQKPEVQELKDLGLEIAPTDLKGPLEKIVEALAGIDVVISAIHFESLHDQIPLAEAAKIADVKRFVPCFFGTVAPKGVMFLNDEKERILEHIRKIYLPYTVIHVGWWYQISPPRVPSGRLDHALIAPCEAIIGDGKASSALTDLRDIGLYTAKIIQDPRTLNRRVFAFADVKTQNDVFKIVERLSGETIKPRFISKNEIEVQLSNLENRTTIGRELGTFEYWLSWGIRGDNTPEHARYLGYLLAEDLYPDFKGRSFEPFIQEALGGK